jgi:hypothetical protein
MAVSLAGIPLHNSLILEGYFDTPDIHYSVTPTFGGEVIQVLPASVGKDLNLVAEGSSVKQGWFCYSQIESLKTIAKNGETVVLNYNGSIYNVLIISFDMMEWYKWDPIHSDKRYSGHIKLKEME